MRIIDGVYIVGEPDITSQESVTLYLIDTGGDLCYLIEVDGKSVLFTGDVAFKCERGLMAGHPITAWVGKRNQKDIETYLNSLRKLLETVKPDILLPGHGLLALRDGWKEIEECIRIVEKYLRDLA